MLGLKRERNFGYLLHPSISKHLKEGSVVADIAAGTAIWIIDVAKKFPQVQCYGLDISDAQFLPKDQMSSNITLGIADAKKEFPKELHGKFDAVQIRYLYAVLWTEDDWKLVARNVKTILKPGGTLQWLEIDSFSSLIPLRSSNTLISTTATRRGFELHRKLGIYHKIGWTFVEAHMGHLLAE